MEEELKLAKGLILAQQYLINQYEAQIKASGEEESHMFDVLHRKLDKINYRFFQCDACLKWELYKDEEMWAEDMQCRICDQTFVFCEKKECVGTFCIYEMVCSKHMRQVCKEDCRGMHDIPSDPSAISRNKHSLCDNAKTSSPKRLKIE
jgi:hypothetical protein